MSNKVYRLSDIPKETIIRFSTGIPELDRTYAQDLQDESSHGLPAGAVSLWAGAGGVGKSRLALMVSHHLNRAGDKVLYIQREVPLSQFQNWVPREIKNPDNFFVHESDNANEHCNLIAKIKPRLVVVDSLSMLRDIQSIVGVREIMTNYKTAAMGHGCHIILLAHLNAEERIKGNTDLSHLPDITAFLTKEFDLEEGKFKFRIDKSRYGVSDRWVMFRHKKNDVVVEETSFGSDPFSSVLYLDCIDYNQCTPLDEANKNRRFIIDGEERKVYPYVLDTNFSLQSLFNYVGGNRYLIEQLSQYYFILNELSVLAFYSDGSCTFFGFQLTDDSDNKVNRNTFVIVDKDRCKVDYSWKDEYGPNWKSKVGFFKHLKICAQIGDHRGKLVR